MINEYYANLKEYENIYKISCYGTVINVKTHNILKPKYDKDGYLKVGLTKDGKQKYKFIHRLVAETFIPNPENKPYVNHIDGDKTNNTVVNLEWCTAKENTNHAIKNDLMKVNEHWEKVKDKMNGSEYLKKPIVLYDKHTDEFVKRFDSISDCAHWFIETGLCKGTLKTAKSSIDKVLAGIRPTTYGFKIYYE